MKVLIYNLFLRITIGEMKNSQRNIKLVLHKHISCFA